MPLSNAKVVWEPTPVIAGQSLDVLDPFVVGRKSLVQLENLGDKAFVTSGSETNVELLAHRAHGHQLVEVQEWIEEMLHFCIMYERQRRGLVSFARLWDLLRRGLAVLWSCDPVLEPLILCLLHQLSA